MVYKLDAAGNETVLYTFRDGRFRCYRDTVRPCFYIPLAQTYGADLRYQVSRMNLEVRTTGDTARLAAGIRGEIHALDHALDEDMPARQAQTLESYRDAGLGQERLSAALLSGLGMLAALIAAIGLYGVLAFAVAQRTREIGIRMALGAASGQVLRSVLLDALGLVGAGIAIGFVGAMLLARLVSSLLYGVSSTDPATCAGDGRNPDCGGRTGGVSAGAAGFQSRSHGGVAIRVAASLKACPSSKWGSSSRFQPHLREPIPQRIARQTQQPRGLALIAIGAP